MTFLNLKKHPIKNVIFFMIIFYELFNLKKKTYIRI